MRTLYNEVPPEAPKPKMWKCLGHVMMGLEAHYALESWNGELDVDREHELGEELMNCAQVLVGNDQAVDGLHLVKEITVSALSQDWKSAYSGALFARTAKRQIMVRFCACDCASRPAKMRCS